MLGSYGKYTHAVVCRVPNSLTQALGAADKINLEEARREHENYVRILRSLGLDVIELPADESLPDSPFVEDTAVVANGVALICRPGHPSRKREVDVIKAILKKELRLPIMEIADPSATLDGGDVLFTGREFFVGISHRTNEAGARAVAAAFPEFPVSPVIVSAYYSLQFKNLTHHFAITPGAKEPPPPQVVHVHGGPGHPRRGLNTRSPRTSPCH